MQRSVGIPRTKVGVELRPLDASSTVETQKFGKDCSGEICQLDDLSLTKAAVFPQT